MCYGSHFHFVMSELVDVNEKRFSRQLQVVGVSGQKKLNQPGF
jgi:hypothetical protein